MSYWSHHVEEMDEITIENLPESWKSQVLEDIIDLYDVPEEVRMDSFFKGESEYWGNMIDATMMRMEDR